MTETHHPADEYKQRGSDALKKGNHHEAEALYTQALVLDPENHTIYSNRSLARLKLKNHEGALADANRCMHLDPVFVKSYFRKGAALEALGRLKDAAEAFKEGYDLDTTSSIMRKKYQQLSREYQRQAEENKENPEDNKLHKQWKEAKDSMKRAEKDFEKWKELADKGDMEACANVGTAYATGHGVEKNLPLAKVFWFQAAQDGIAHAQHNLGTNIGGDEGKKWLYAAAAQGNFEAHLSLADIFRLAGDNEEELVWAIKAADSHENLEAQTRAALCSFERGNMGLAAKYFLKACTKMNSSDPDFNVIQCTLGDLYSTGTGVEKDIAKAIDHFKHAAKAGHPEAIFKIHEVYCTEGQQVEAKKALAIIGKSALQTAQHYHLHASAYLLQAKQSEPVDLSHVRTAEMRWKNALNRGYTAAALHLAECATLKKQVGASNEFMRMYVDNSLRSSGRNLEKMLLVGEKYAASVLKTTKQKEYTKALIYCSVARDLVGLANAQIGDIVLDVEATEGGLDVVQEEEEAEMAKEKEEDDAADEEEDEDIEELQEQELEELN